MGFSTKTSLRNEFLSSSFPTIICFYLHATKSCQSSGAGTTLLVLPCSSVFCNLCPNTVTVLNQRDSHTASCTTGACKLQCKLEMGRVRERVPEPCHMVSPEHYSFYSILHLSYSDKRLEHPVFSDKRLGHPVSISVCNCFTA